MRTDFNRFLNIAPLGINTTRVYLAVILWFFIAYWGILYTIK